MTSKIIGYYTDSLNQAEGSRLTLEIGRHHLACAVRNAAGEGPEGFELFSIEETGADWEDAFAEIQGSSRILTRGYAHTKCYYNTAESILMPAEKFSVTAAEDYLSLVFGEDAQSDTRYETLNNPGLMNVYRIVAQLHNGIGRHFVLYLPHHINSAIANALPTQGGTPEHFVSLQFYPKHFILAYTKAGHLQLIRHFKYQSLHDIQYYLGAITAQFHIPGANSQVAISGMIAGDTIPKDFLQSIFGRVVFDTITDDEAFLSATAGYPPHYFVPFYKLPS